MHRISLFFTLIFFLGIAFYSNGAVGQAEATLGNSYVAVYYFHGNFRCFSCHRIEQYTKEAVELFFNDELSSGKMVFKAVNVDKKENQRFINDYKLYTKSVVVSLVKDAKELKYDNLAKVWNYLGNRKKFFNYIKNEVNKYLEEVKWYR